MVVHSKEIAARKKVSAVVRVGEGGGGLESGGRGWEEVGWRGRRVRRGRWEAEHRGTPRGDPTPNNNFGCPVHTLQGSSVHARVPCYTSSLKWRSSSSSLLPSSELS